MTRKKLPDRYYWTIERDEMENMPIYAALDMLRYDGAVVESNAPQGMYLFSSPNGPTPARWQSFGIKTLVIIDPMTRQPLDPIQWPHKAFWETHGVQ